MIRKALSYIDQFRDGYDYEINEDCWIKVDKISREPIEIGLTPKGMQKIEGLFFETNLPPMHGEIKTIYGIPIVVTKGLMKDE